MRYIALLRGINVGGKKKIKMKGLRALVGSLGFENVASYINSGNLGFDSPAKSDAKLAAMIHDAIEQQLGLDVSIMVRSRAELVEIVKKNPYDGQFDSYKDLHVFFLARELSKDEKGSLLEKNSDAELITVDGRTVYYLLRISIIDSVLGKGFLDKKLKVPATARNWRTVQKLAEL